MTKKKTKGAAGGAPIINGRVGALARPDPVNYAVKTSQPITKNTDSYAKVIK